MNQSLFRADLHCHSTCSDGTLFPKQLLYHAKEVGLSGISITDHDTMSAYDPSLFETAATLDLYLLPGVEISSSFEHTTLHILAYGKNLLSEGFQQFLEEIQRQREERNQKILDKLAKKNIHIQEQELKEFVASQSLLKKNNIGRPHIALLMMEKKYVGSLQEAFDKYLKDGAPCFEKGFEYPPIQVIEAIHKENGLAVIAHPHFLKNKGQIRSLMRLPFDGIECYYSKLDPAFEQRWIDRANQKKWIKTGGSDFHGALKPHIDLGCSWVDKETFFKMYHHE